MLKLTQLIGFGTGGAFQANAVDYNGSSDYLLRASDYAGIADSRQGILSFWMRIDGGDGTQMFPFSNYSQTCRIVRETSNDFTMLISSAGGASAVFRQSSGGSLTASASWRHALLSWDTNFSAGNKLLHFYIDGVDVGTSITDSHAAFDVDYTVGAWSVAATTDPLYPFNGALAEMYFAPGQYLDFSQQANRELFRSPAGKPVGLGSDGSLPTGTAPILYLPNPAATVGNNAGTGGNLTINGSPATASTSPSD